MAYDFPNSLTVNQVVTGPGGTQYRWDGVKWVPVSQQAMYAPAGAINDIGRNLFHNGLFNIQQRGAGPWNVNNVFTLDRWAISFGTSDALTLTTVTLADADRTAIGDEAAEHAVQAAFTGSSASAAVIQFYQSVENPHRLSGKTVTISFWARATVGTPAIGLGAMQGFTSPSYPITNLGKTSALGSTWQRYSATGTIPSATGATIDTSWPVTEFIFYLSAAAGSPHYGGSGNLGAQSGTVQFWGMQIELGTGATPLEKRDPQIELALCQRYYCTLYSQGGGYAGAAGNWVGSPGYFAVAMRATPTVTLLSTGSSNNTQAPVAGTHFGANDPGSTWANAAAIAAGFATFNWRLAASAEV